MVTTAATITAETVVALVTNATMIMSVVKVVIKLCRSSHNVPVICLILTKTEFSRQIFVEVLCIKFHEYVQWKPSSSTLICGQT